MKKILFIAVILSCFFILHEKSNAQEKETVVGNMLITRHGGIAFKFTTNTLVQHGQLVAADTGTGYVKLADSTNVMGVAFLLRNSNKDSAVTGTSIWVVVSGTAETRILTNDSDNANKYAIVSATAGIADIRAYHIDFTTNKLQAWAVYRRGYQRNNGYWYNRLKLGFK